MTSDKEKIREVMSILGSVRSEKKTAAVRRNIAKATRDRVAGQTLLPCICDAVGEETHKRACPVYMREWRRRQRAEAKKGEEG